MLNQNKGKIVVNKHQAQNREIVALVVYFVILTASFFASCFVLDIRSEANVFLLSVVYACVVLACIQLGRAFLPMLKKSSGEIVYTVLVNGAGIAMSVVFLLIMSLVMPELAVSIITIIVSSIIAFIVLGTLAPLLLMDRRSSAR